MRNVFSQPLPLNSMEKMIRSQKNMKENSLEHNHQAIRLQSREQNDTRMDVIHVICSDDIYWTNYYYY